MVSSLQSWGPGSRLYCCCWMCDDFGWETIFAFLQGKLILAHGRFTFLFSSQVDSFLVGGLHWKSKNRRQDAEEQLEIEGCFVNHSFDGVPTQVCMYRSSTQILPKLLPLWIKIKKPTRKAYPNMPKITFEVHHSSIHDSENQESCL